MAPISNRPVKVLLVEDEAAEAELIRVDLKEHAVRLDYEVVQAQRLRDALDRLRADDSFDVVLLDLGLPDSQGLSTLEEFLRHSHVPVVVLTGQEDQALGVEAVHLGAQDYIPKGVARGTMLSQLIRYAMERSERTAVLLSGIEARKEAEERLRESEERFRAFAEAASDYFAVWDENLCLVYASSLGKSAFLHDPDNTLGKHRSEVTKRLPEYEEVFQAHLRDCEAHKPYRDVEWGVYDKDGNTRYLRSSGVPFFDSSGAFKGYCSVARDITEHRKLEDQLRQSLKMEAVGQLTGGVAHDFNNLLTVISGNLELLELNADGDERRAKHIRMALDAARRGAQLTDRLLTFSRRQVITPEAAEPGKLIGEMLPLLRRTLGESIGIKMEIAKDVGRARLDVSQFENALLNLALNARDAMVDGGRLLFEAWNFEFDAAGAAQVPNLAPGSYVCVSVSDTGSGMPKDVLDCVFDPFFTTKEVGQGSGLGLSMVYGFMTQLRGAVTVYSEQGLGTTVRLYFPRVDGAEGKKAPAGGEAEEGRLSGSETILIVEDDAGVRATLAMMLHEMGYTVLEAGDGTEGLQVIMAHDDIDLLLTDVVMPKGMTGRELAEVALAARPGLRVLLTSGYPRENLSRDVELDGGVAYLPKPYDNKHLARMVRDVLDGGV